MPLNRDDVLRLIADERDKTAKAMSRVLSEERAILFAEAVGEREEHARTRSELADVRKRSDADRKRLRCVEATITDLQTRADMSDRVAPLEAELAALREQVARPALPAPAPAAVDMEAHKAARADREKETANG